MYELLGICVMLAALMLLNAGASLAVAGIWRLLSRRVSTLPARARADLLFGLRISAPALATIVVLFFLIPSYLGYEPRVSSEIVSKKLAALAFLSAASVGFALWRTIRSWMATRALRQQWTRGAKRIEISGVDIPSFRISHRFPVIAVVGTLRPQLFIADSVLSSLNADELAAAVAHECGHLMARDNLKRTLLRLCRDSLLMVPFGRAVDRFWADTAESAADEFAARQSPATALNLASALVTIARMVPAGARADVPLGAYLVGAETQGVKGRIKRLIEMSSDGIHSRSSDGWSRLLSLSGGMSIALAAVLLATNSKVLIEVHAIVERAVHLLS